MKRHTAHFIYRNKKIPFHFWVRKDTENPDTIIFLGTGQIKHIPYWVAKASPAGVVVVEGLPHWHSQSSAEDIIPFSKEYSKCAFGFILNTYGRKRMHIIGQSQAAPGLLWLATVLPDKVGNIALILPMGLNVKHLGDTDDERYRELKRRSARSLLHPEQIALKNIYAGVLLAKIILTGLKDGSTRRKYSKGVSHNSLLDLAMLTQKGRHKVSLFLGEHDMLFPAKEIKKSLIEAGISDVAITIAPKKSHTSLTTKRSGKILHSAIKAVRT